MFSAEARAVLSSEQRSAPVDGKPERRLLNSRPILHKYQSLDEVSQSSPRPIVQDPFNNCAIAQTATLTSVLHQTCCENRVTDGLALRNTACRESPSAAVGTASAPPGSSPCASPRPPPPPLRDKSGIEGYLGGFYSSVHVRLRSRSSREAAW